MAAKPKPGPKCWCKDVAGDAGGCPIHAKSKPKPKERTIRAWAVVCPRKIHELSTVRRVANFGARWYDTGTAKCGPHRVVALVGKVKIKEGK